MIVTTTSTVDGKPIQEYLGVATGEAIMGANALKDLAAGVRDIVGGRSGTYEKVVARGRDIAMAELLAHAEELGANAIVGLDIDYETIDRSSNGSSSSMLMVSVSGTAVRIAE